MAGARFITAVARATTVARTVAAAVPRTTAAVARTAAVVPGQTTVAVGVDACGAGILEPVGGREVAVELRAKGLDCTGSISGLLKKKKSGGERQGTGA